MIEKLKMFQGGDVFNATERMKINELVDAVNNQQIQLNNHECRLLDLQNQINEHDQEIDDCAATVSKMENVAKNGNFAKNAQDTFAEQRKWIGKLCWFWDEDRKDAFCDVLGYIDKDSKYPYVNVDCYSGYKHCEPVKPDDDIIYKGE